MAWVLPAVTIVNISNWLFLRHLNHIERSS
jgi:hypothetical protein